MSVPSGPSTSGRDLLVIGLGTEHRGDDRCGLDVVRSLPGGLPEGVRVVEGPGEATALLELWSGSDRVIVVDAVRSGSLPGTVHRLDAGPNGLPSRLGATSTHGLSLADAIELARSLGRLPRRVTVLGIEVADLGPREGLTGPVADAVGRVRAILLEEIGVAVPGAPGD